MNERSAHLLRVLAFAPEGSRLDPIWEPASRAGVTYRVPGGELLGGANAIKDLEYLADHEFLERVFVERISMCPSCESHALNVHECCAGCGSSNLKPFAAIFHFRCGYVGPSSAFAREDRGLRCPKCSRLLKDLGTDHDSPGDFYECNGCAAKFQTPAIGARCLSCGARFSGEAAANIGHRDIFAYRVTAAAQAAMREKRAV